MARPAVAAILAAALAGATAHAAMAAPSESPTPPFPASTDQGAAMIWLRDNTNLGVGRFVAFAPDNVVVVLTDEVATRSPTAHRVTFRQEATRIDFVSRTGGRSLRGAGEIDCATGSFRADKVELLSGTNLKGEVVASEGPETAARVPRAGSAPAQAIQQVCGAGSPALAPLVSTSRPTAAAARTAPPPAPAPPAATPPAPPARVAQAEATPLPPPPRRQSVDEGTPLPPTRPPAEQPPQPPTPPTPPPAPSAAPPSPAASPAAPAGETVAQIGAFSTRDAAERAWSRLSELFPELMKGKSIRIDAVTTNGAEMYRSAIGGFKTRADAVELCTRLMASSESCFVRSGP